MEQGLISDTLLFWSSGLVQGMTGPVFILVMMLIFFLLGFVVPSSSGLAVLSMPIMAPLADTVGIPRSVVVCAYQWGQYAMLYLAPTGLVPVSYTHLDVYKRQRSSRRVARPVRKASRTCPASTAAARTFECFPTCCARI